MPVTIRDGALVSFGQFRADVGGAAVRLREQRIIRGVLAADDSYLFAVGLFALLHAGADVVLPPNTQPGRLAQTLGDRDTLVTDDAVTDGFLLTQDAGPHSGPLPPIDPTRPRIRFYTSGSTGTRKAIDKTLGQLEREIAGLESLFGPRLGPAHIEGTVSHQHIYGLTFRVLWPLAAGRRFGARSHHVWESLLATLEPPTAIVSSPAHLSRLGGLPPLPAESRPPFIVSAGSPLSWAAAQESLAILGCLPTEIFGSTETGAIAYRHQRAADTPWQSLPGVEATANAEGDLAVRSPYVDGLVPTADRVEFVAADLFHFRGRGDRIVKIEGKRVSMPEVERDLAGLPWVAAAAVVPISEGRTFLAAVVSLTEEGCAALAQEGKFRFERRLRRALGSTQDQAALPRRWRFVDSLPIDGMGKQSRAALAALVGSGADHG